MDDMIIAKYKILVDFLAEVLGENCEVVLHDMRNLENSIIAIKNGYISGRKEGDSFTNLALKIINNKDYKDQEYLVNYGGKTKYGKKLRSSTLLIRNKEEKVIAMLCINFDISKLIEAKDILDKLIFRDTKIEKTNEELSSEKFTNSIEELMNSIIESSINDLSISPKRMTSNEKEQIVKELEDKGVFLLKNAVTKVAKRLETSEATIYRYLNN